MVSLFKVVSCFIFEQKKSFSDVITDSMEDLFRWGLKPCLLSPFCLFASTHEYIYGKLQMPLSVLLHLNSTHILIY